MTSKDFTGTYPTHDQLKEYGICRGDSTSDIVYDLDPDFEPIIGQSPELANSRGEYKTLDLQDSDEQRPINSETKRESTRSAKDLALKRIKSIARHEYNYHAAEYIDSDALPLLQKEPTTYYEAVKDSEWAESIQSEMDSLIANNTWELVERPSPGTNVVKSKWIFKQNRAEERSLDW